MMISATLSFAMTIRPAASQAAVLRRQQGRVGGITGDRGELALGHAHQQCLDAGHGFRNRSVVADDGEQQSLFPAWRGRQVFESPGYAGWERDRVIRLEIDEFLVSRALLPDEAPGALQRYEGLIRVVVVDDRAIAGL